MQFRRFASLGLAFSFLFFVFVFALVPGSFAGYSDMRSFDLLEGAIFDSGTSSSAVFTGNKTVFAYFQTGIAERSQWTYLTIYCASQPSSVFLGTQAMSLMGSSGRYYSYSLSGSINASTINLSFNFSDNSNHTVYLVDMTGIRDTNIDVGSMAGAYFRSPTDSELSSISVGNFFQYRYQTYSTDYPSFHGFDSEQYSGLTCTYYFYFPAPSIMSDFVTFRFYVSPSYAHFQLSDSGIGDWDLIDSPSFSSASLIGASSLGVLTNIIDAPCSVSFASSVPGTSPASLVCDVTFDLHDIHWVRDYLAVAISVLPSSYNSDLSSVPNGKIQLEYSLRYVGGHYGFDDVSSNQLALFTSWYSSFISEQLSSLQIAIDSDFQSFESTFTDYLDRVLEALDATPSDSSLSSRDSLDTQLSGLDSWESSQLGDVSSQLGDFSNQITGGLGAFTPALLFVQRYSNVIASQLNSRGLLIVFIFPVFIGIFFFLVRAVPGASRVSRPPKSR